MSPFRASTARCTTFRLPTDHEILPFGRTTRDIKAPLQRNGCAFLHVPGDPYVFVLQALFLSFKGSRTLPLVENITVLLSANENRKLA